MWWSPILAVFTVGPISPIPLKRAGCRTARD